MFDTSISGGRKRDKDVPAIIITKASSISTPIAKSELFAIAVNLVENNDYSDLIDLIDI